MLEKYSKPILERQKARFPVLVSRLEELSQVQRGGDPFVMQSLREITHDLVNELSIVGMVLELDAIQCAERVECTVLSP
jgi:hypothetical protein